MKGGHLEGEGLGKDKRFSRLEIAVGLQILGVGGTNVKSESCQTVESKTFIRTLLTLLSSPKNHLLCEVFSDTPTIQPPILSISR